MTHLIGKLVMLLPYTKQRCHEFYRQYIPDRLMTYDPFVYDEQLIEQYYTNKAMDASRRFFAIVQAGITIGEIQLKRINFSEGCATLSIILANDSVKGKGYGSEAIQLIASFAFSEFGLNTIFADAVLRNTRSRHVLEKLGFVHLCNDDISAYYQYKKLDD